ncbi:MAG TPA: 50S ribosomal protein L18 [Anaerolineales bacterium]|nr:50S ribosomal protein L18 [Anaerolineales bacterium]HLF08977.1 50S ribosomal protein L18 [Dehalococcoidia bacterium]
MPKTWTRGKIALNARQRRHIRVRQRVDGTAGRPRLSVFRSLQHIYAQVIDDSRGHTLVAASTLEPALRDRVDGMSKVAQAQLVGTTLAERALAAGVRAVVFDRGGYLYHGRVKAVADAARQAGLQF